MRVADGSLHPFSALAIQRQKMKRDNVSGEKYRKFRQSYFHDRVAFLHDCIDWGMQGDTEAGPAPYQEEIVSFHDADENAKVAARGPRGLGKTALAAIDVLHFSLTRDVDCDWKVPTTASVWRQLQKFLWPEIHKWARKLRWDVIGRPPFKPSVELLDMSISLTTGEAFAAASNNPELIEGAHADHLFYVFDEGKAIPDAVYDSAEGSFSTAGARGRYAGALVISTPGQPEGRFYNIHARKPGFSDWTVRHVTTQEVIAAGQMTAEWVERRREQWGEDSDLFLNHILGEFSKGLGSGVIPLAWVELANERWEQWKDRGQETPPDCFVGLGVDVAREGDDNSVIAPRYDLPDYFKTGKSLRLISELIRFHGLDTMVVTGHVVSQRRQRVASGQSPRLVIDVIGVGSGVVDRLNEQKIPGVEAFNAGSSTNIKDASKTLEFLNARAMAWWSLREALDPARGELIALPPDDTLIADLTTPKWTVTSAGRIQIEAKAEIKKRLGRSTDDGDAVVMILAPSPQASRRWGPM